MLYTYFLSKAVIHNYCNKIENEKYLRFNKYCGIITLWEKLPVEDLLENFPCKSAEI